MSSSKCRASSPLPYDSSHKRKRTSSPYDTESSGSYEWYSFQTCSELLDEQPSPSTSFIIPPDTDEIDSSPFSITKHLDESSPIRETQVSSGSLRSSVSTCPPKTPSGRRLPLNTISPGGDIRTPQTQECPPTCFCRSECDTFGKPRQIDAEQLPQRSPSTPGTKGLNVRRMLVPRSLWGGFKMDRRPQRDNRRSRLKAYHGSGIVVTVTNEDLWADEKNPFLLTRFDFADNQRPQMSLTLPPESQFRKPID